MRAIVTVCILFAGATTLLAQEQERKLIDRILKPNTTLANPAQNKSFGNTRPASFDKPVPVRSFYLPRKTDAKTFKEEKVFTPRQFAARHFRAGHSRANIASRSQLQNGDTIVATQAATAGARVAPESTTTSSSASRQYAGSRPFLDQGKSQKSFAAPNTPLTIEQVRELLNKSK